MAAQMLLDDHAMNPLPMRDEMIRMSLLLCVQRFERDIGSHQMHCADLYRSEM